MHIIQEVLLFDAVQLDQAFHGRAVLQKEFRAQVTHFCGRNVNILTHKGFNALPDCIPQARGGWVQGIIQVKEQGFKTHA
ncbi:hypothetical protein SDC9_189101 [bioreactor metagenome]|uniref:Uncharacterized protein n=1 Tax=bioreactor metagenome TaxID=1076179 RepID=A0A645HR71_9ZZZZ